MREACGTARMTGHQGWSVPGTSTPASGEEDFRLLPESEEGERCPSPLVAPGSRGVTCLPCPWAAWTQVS